VAIVRRASGSIDRRAFLGGAGALGLALVAGTGTTTAAGRKLAKLSAQPARTLRQAMRGPIFNRGAAGYRAAAAVYNERFDSVMPSAVGRPLQASDVQGAVRWAVAHDVALRARSGGHSYAGYSTLSGGVVLDLRNLRSISVDLGARTATVGAGAQLIDVYRALAARGVTIPAGSCPSVGVGGHVLGGGMGLAGRGFGLAADNLLAAQIVTADGRLRTVNRHTDPGLLWALRGGGGGNFGIVTQLQLRVHRVPRTSSWFQVSWPWSSASAAIAAWQAWAPHARNQLSSVFHLETGGSSPLVNVTGQYLGPASDLGRLLAPLRNAPGAQVSFGNQDYFGLQTRFAGCLGRSVASCHTEGTRAGGQLERASFNAKSDYVTKPLPGAGRAALISAIEIRQGQTGSGAILFDSYGGAINQLAPSATAFVHRRTLYCIQYLAYNGGGPWLGQTHNRMRRYVSGMAYQNYIDPALAGWQQAYYGSNYARLQSIRRRVDPGHQFNFPQAIGR
jgi:FAD binding domain/Berberine and berberine like